MSDTPASPPFNDSPAPAGNAERDMSPVECAEQLKQRFPALFTGPAKPLKLRIQADIQERAPGVFTKKALSAFLRRHTGSTSYLVAMTRSPTRFDLDGQAAGEITEEHRRVAAEELARRRALRQERERQAESERRQEENARRERAHLLRDLERSPLTPANFAALKGLTLEALQAQLELARREAAERPPAPPRPQPDRGPGPRRGGPGGREGAPRNDRGGRDARGGPGSRGRGPRTPRPADDAGAKNDSGGKTPH